MGIAEKLAIPAQGKCAGRDREAFASRQRDGKHDRYRHQDEYQRDKADNRKRGIDDHVQRKPSGMRACRCHRLTRLGLEPPSHLASAIDARKMSSRMTDRAAPLPHSPRLWMRSSIRLGASRTLPPPRTEGVM